MSSSQTDQGPKPYSATSFRIRSLLLATVIVAVGAAVCGAYARGRSEAEQPYLFTLWGSGFASFSVWMLGYLWQRHRVEKKVGAVRFRLPWFLCLRNRLLSLKAYGVFMFVCTVPILILSTVLCSKSAEQGRSLWQVVAFGLNSGLFLALGLISFWWSAELWIGDQGLAWLSSFRPWGKIKKWHLHEKKSNTLVLAVPSGLLKRTIAVRVPESQYAQLTEFLQEKVGDPVAPGFAGR